MLRESIWFLCMVSRSPVQNTYYLHIGFAGKLLVRDTEHKIKDHGPGTGDSGLRTQHQGARIGLRMEYWQLGIKDSGWNSNLGWWAFRNLLNYRAEMAWCTLPNWGTSCFPRSWKTNSSKIHFNKIGDTLQLRRKFFDFSRWTLTGLQLIPIYYSLFFS